MPGAPGGHDKGMSDFPTQPEADAVDEGPGPVTGSAPQQAEVPGASAEPERVVSSDDVVSAEQGVAAGEPAPLDPYDTEH